MKVRVKGHFDGKHVVLDEPLDVPAGSEVLVIFGEEATLPTVAGMEPAPTVEGRLAALKRLASLAVSGLNISDESLRRANLYRNDATGDYGSGRVSGDEDKP